MRYHAAAVRLGAVSYVSGADDRGVPPRDTRALATAAGASWRVLPGAAHLGAIKTARRQVLDLALSTFDRAADPPPRRAPQLVSYPSLARSRPAIRRSMSSSPL